MLFLSRCNQPLRHFLSCTKNPRDSLSWVVHGRLSKAPRDKATADKTNKTQQATASPTKKGKFVKITLHPLFLSHSLIFTPHRALSPHNIAKDPTQTRLKERQKKENERLEINRNPSKGLLSYPLPSPLMNPSLFIKHARGSQSCIH